MVFSNKKQGQSLPLNTIVIAILVIIVLLVIVVFFTSKVGDTSGTIDDQTTSLQGCNLNNPAINAIYSNVDGDHYKDTNEKTGTDCTQVTIEGKASSAVPGVVGCCGIK